MAKVTSLTLSFTNPPAIHSAIASLAFLLVLEFARFIPTSGTLHLLLWLPHVFAWLTPYHSRFRWSHLRGSNLIVLSKVVTIHHNTHTHMLLILYSVSGLFVFFLIGLNTCWNSPVYLLVYFLYLHIRMLSPFEQRPSLAHSLMFSQWQNWVWQLRDAKKILKWKPE